MRVKTENGRIYIVTREYSDFHMQTVDVEHGTTIGEARRLRNELDEAINKIEETTCCDTPKLSYGLSRDQWKCTNCGTRSRDRE